MTKPALDISIVSTGARAKLRFNVASADGVEVDTETARAVAEQIGELADIADSAPDGVVVLVPEETDD